MNVPLGAGFITVTDDDSPAAFLDAAAEHLRQEALWADPPPLADGCGGLDAELSRSMMANPGGYDLQPDSSITRKPGPG